MAGMNTDELLRALRVLRGEENMECEQRHAGGRSYLAPLILKAGTEKAENK